MAKKTAPTKVFDTLLAAAHTRQMGDGRVYITDIEHVERIRTAKETAKLRCETAPAAPPLAIAAAVGA